MNVLKEISQPRLCPRSSLTSVMICWTNVVPDLERVHTKTSSSLDSKVRINLFVASSCRKKTKTKTRPSQVVKVGSINAGTATEG